ncbi:uncharacterized protein LOC116306555 [Actinia tenebrosa]|uniref:Uncharacterized protein LOC116306555 n=1 Tax=Actinia tenebrosa TaxID=6105 RepID=A0A6P8IZ75_ACTTE|nr:uncharacterized protein LOC116306555 [Actinia tenebrosa]
MTLEPDIFFSLFDEKNKDLYYLFKKNMVGGPSIIFHRYHEAGKTKIREVEMRAKGIEPKTCQKIVGLDANALYLGCIMADQPTGSFTRRREETGFQKESSVKMVSEWLEWEAETRGIPIRHQVNDVEKRIGARKLPVDGFHGPSQTVFQFHARGTRSSRCGSARGERQRKPTLLSPCCHPAVKEFLSTKFQRPMDKYKTLNKDQILQAVLDGKLFGVVECDIFVPDHLKEKFSEMCPIFKNTEISREDIGDYMRGFAEEHKIMPRPRRSLIGSYFGEKILLATPLLKWYLEHGLEVTKIYQIVEYTPSPCFKPFGEAVSNARRAGDVDPSKAIIADTMKLVGNSSYGKTITDQERHREVKFCDETKTSRLVNSSFFRQLEVINENTYEIQSAKKRISLNLPMQIGFFVYQYAKLRMLEFYYDCIDKYLDRSDFQYCEMDTDSAYIAFSRDSVEGLVRPEMRAEFETGSRVLILRRTGLMTREPLVCLRKSGLGMG